MMEDIETMTSSVEEKDFSVVMEDKITVHEDNASCSDALMTDTGTSEKLASNQSKDSNDTTKIVTSDSDKTSFETKDCNCTEGRSSEALSGTVGAKTLTEELAPNDSDGACSVAVDSIEDKGITSDESKEVCCNPGMAENSITKDITASDYDKHCAMMDNEKRKENTPSENNELCEKSVMKNKPILLGQTITDISLETESNKYTDVYSDVAMTTDLSAGEHSCTTTEQRIARKVFGKKILRSHKKDAQDGADICFQKANTTNGSNEKSTASTETSDSVWDYKVIHLDSSDLKVVEAAATEDLPTGNSGQAARQVQQVGKKVKGTKRSIPTDIKKCQPKTDTSFSHLTFRKILPKPQINIVFNRNIEVQGNQDVLGNILNPVTCGQDMKRHKENLDTTQRKRSYQCTQCEKVFAEVSDLKKHERTHTSVSKYKCAHCDTMFVTQSDVTEHERTHISDSQYKCTHCNKMFVTQSDVTEHERTHISDSQYKCAHCDKIFVTQSDVTEHERTHISDSQYKCAHCDKMFATQSDVTEHERSHTASVKPYKCTYCNKGFAQKRHAKEHERTHTAEKIHKCPYCNKAFPRKSHLKRHEFIHNGESPHKCTYCGKVFRNKWDVQVHERIHTGVKPFTCKLCNKTFTQRSGLNVHGRVHTGVAPYQCNQCSKAFTRKSHLMEHERIHTGTKPYTCTHCSKAFTQKGTLKKHERTHDKPYKCENCDKVFSRRSDLIKHENVHTGAQI